MLGDAGGGAAKTGVLCLHFAHARACMATKVCIMFKSVPIYVASAFIFMWMHSNALAVGSNQIVNMGQSKQDIPAHALVRANNKKIKDEYIVVLVDDSSETAPEKIQNIAKTLTKKHSALHRYTYKSVLRGFSMRATEAQALALAADSRVAYVAEDVEAYANGIQTSPPYGLDRIDQRGSGGDSLYRYSYTGQGVHAYVVDSGINTTHQDFQGRATLDVDYMGGNNPMGDCHGHGTHVAGTIGGALYGVAKQVRLHGIRVLGCDGKGSSSTVIAAMDWVALNGARPAVINMSIGFPLVVPAVDSAISRASASGVLVVVSAGNDAKDACTMSPGSAASALTVGAISHTWDVRASFSNYGSCVDIFAPGTLVLSASNTSNTGARYDQGTSMAAPHVAGVAALLLQKTPSANPTFLFNTIRSQATAGAVVDPGANSPNYLLYSLGSPGTSTTSLTTSSSAVGVNQSFNYTATVSGTTPTGNVKVFNGGAEVGSCNLVNGQCQGSISFASVGQKPLTANYYGDPLNAISSTPSAVTVSVKASSSTTIAASPNPSYLGLPVNIIASVSGSSPSGNVAFLNGSSSLGSAPVISGVATLNATFNTIGTLNLTASYAGDGNNFSSVSGASYSLQVKSPEPTITAWAVAPKSTVILNTPQSLSVTISRQGGGSINCDNSSGACSYGKLRFLDGSVLIAEKDVTSGTFGGATGYGATVMWTPSISGKRSVSVQFMGTLTGATSSVTKDVNVLTVAQAILPSILMQVLDGE